MKQNRGFAQRIPGLILCLVLGVIALFAFTGSGQTMQDKVFSGVDSPPATTGASRTPVAFPMPQVRTKPTPATTNTAVAAPVSAGEMGIAGLAIDRKTWRATQYMTAAQLKTNYGITRVPKYVVIHQTMGAFPGDAKWLAGRNGVSVQYLVAPNGAIYEMCDPATCIAYQAGTLKQNQYAQPIREVWGYGNENFHSIGIEISVRGPSVPYTEAQLAAVDRLVAYLVLRFNIPLDRNYIVGHYELSKAKIDPTNWNWPVFMANVQHEIQTAQR